MEYAIHTQVQQGVRIGLAEPYKTTYPESIVTLNVKWGNARAIEVQLSATEVGRLRSMLAAFAERA